MSLLDQGLLARTFSRYRWPTPSDGCAWWPDFAQGAGAAVTEPIA